ncbi:pyridoxal phosphate-dependent aminotransferase [Kitasatospora sp. NPDC101801]|uniref:pyridoxal phosphate-dependent aminotransferase n=1 Tax=Kitasatospora sp. NPDC101801 TaxID=3364103 RepID=UPI0037FBB429
MVGRKVSPNLDLNNDVAERRTRGESIVHLAFGEARLPVHPALKGQLAASSGENAYGAVPGGRAVRREAAGYFSRRNLPTEPEQVVVAPGSKPLLMAVQFVVPGDLVIPRPAWNTYKPQGLLAGKQVYEVDIPAECGGVPDPVKLRETVRAARAAGGNPRLVVLTLPDNPTGTTVTPELVREICAVAEEEDLYLISDEIYRDVVHDPATPVLSPAEVLPERTIVTNGLSKTLALGGWRIGVARFPDNVWGNSVRDGVISLASEVWSTLAIPMQEVAAYAFSEPPEVRDRFARSARLHGAVARAVYRIMIDAGATCRPPTGGFYVYPDFEPRRAVLEAKGITDAQSLFRYLFDEFGIVVLAGDNLGDDAGALRFKAATSLLYGHTREEQQLALDSEDPLSLPHIRDVLTRIEEAFTKLVG